MIQLQPGDHEEADLRMADAILLARYFTRHPGPVGSVRYRIENLAGCQTSEHELDLLVDLVEHIMDLAEWQRRKANPRRHPETTDWTKDGRAV